MAQQMHQQQQPMQMQNQQQQPQLQQGQPQQQQQQQGQPQQQQRQQQEDKHISKIRELVNGPLKQKWADTLRETAVKITTNGQLDSGTGTPKPYEVNNLESNLEDFYAVCNQIEAHLKCAIEVHNVSAASCRYMTIPPVPSRIDLSNQQNPSAPEFLSYSQYISTAKQQIQFASEMRNHLNQATKDVTTQNRPNPSQQQQQ